MIYGRLRTRRQRALFALGCLDTWMSIGWLLYQDSLVSRITGVVVLLLWLRFIYWVRRTLPLEPWEELEQRMKG